MSWVTTVVICGRYIPRSVRERLDQGYQDASDRYVSFGELSAYTPRDNCTTWTHWHGCKGPESDVFGGAFNHLDTGKMLEWLRDLPWYGEVLVVVMPEDGEQTYTRFGVRTDDNDPSYDGKYPFTERMSNEDTQPAQEAGT